MAWPKGPGIFARYKSLLLNLSKELHKVRKLPNSSLRMRSSGGKGSSDAGTSHTVVLSDAQEEVFLAALLKVYVAVERGWKE